MELLDELNPVPFQKRSCGKRICVVDTETDPFGFDDTGRPVIVKPFTLGFYDGENYFDFWGLDCVDQFFSFLAREYSEPLLIYAHNGGGFDFFFMLPFLDSRTTPTIINGRLTKVFMQGHEFRDSYKIYPQALSTFAKDDFDYAKMHVSQRDKYKDQILHYQMKDCLYLYELIVGFHDMFGDHLTIGSASIANLRHFHGFAKLNEVADEKFRQFYYGGRNQCFEGGILPGAWKLYDVNSMYPKAMRDYSHPIGKAFELYNKIGKSTAFAVIEARNYGALPSRAEDGSLTFEVERGEFFATIHEIEAGEETGTLKIERVKKVYNFEHWTKFDGFIDHFYGLRERASIEGDKVGKAHYKGVLVNAYGKFAQNPRKYHDWQFTVGELPEGDTYNAETAPEGWQVAEANVNTGLIMYRKPIANMRRAFRNVATAASITGAARAELLRGLNKATRPIYCDTDSIFCESFSGEVHPTKLGAWDLEAEGDCMSIAGKKLYHLTKGGETVKKASKGARLEGHEIDAVAQGEVITYTNPVPNFHVDGSVEFVTREIRSTL